MTSNEWWRTLPTPVQSVAAVPGHKTLLSKYFPDWHNAQECPHAFIPQGPDLAFNFFCWHVLSSHVPHVCFTYINLSEIVLFCWVRSCDSCLSVSDSATKLRVYLLFWGVTSSAGTARLPTADFMSPNSPHRSANPMATSPTPPPLSSSPLRIPTAPPSPPSSPSDTFSLLVLSYPYASGANPLTSKLTRKQLEKSVWKHALSEKPMPGMPPHRRSPHLRVPFPRASTLHTLAVFPLLLPQPRPPRQPPLSWHWARVSGRRLTRSIALKKATSRLDLYQIR